MHLSALLRLFASLCLLVLLGLPGCSKSAPSYGGRSEAPATRPPDGDGGSQLATRGDFSSAESAPVYTESDGEYGGTYQDAPAAEPAPSAARDEAVATAPVEQQRRRHRPGLGTSYGEHHRSRVVTAPFVRGTSQPDVLLSLWYNDEGGIRQAQGGYGRIDDVSQASTSDSAFVVSAVDEYGYALPGAQVGSKRYVMGQPGQRYKLRVQNNSAYRFEVVASVDGLDVIDGQPASFAKRGYILDPWSSITIDGWRTGDSSVAAFRFSAMEDSYAERKGQGRNIGVVGFAFFHERGGVPWEELHRRDSADPFPRRYAEPPPPRRWR